jgi:MFS family permease
MDAAETAGVARAEGRALTISQRNVMLALLTLVNTCSAVDRAIIATVLEPIKAEFALSDAQMGAVAGLAFAIAHAIVAIPMGALADRTSRRNLIAACLAFWSAATAVCGLVQSYLQLFLARMGVGAGEAGGQGATLSTVSDLFPPEKRATAISIYYLSTPIGTLYAGVVGGLVAASLGWRAALMAAGAPGLLLAVVMLLFGRDPPRGAPSAHGREAGAASFMEVLRFMASQRSLLHLMAALAIITVVVSGAGTFTYAFFMRYHHMNLRALGPIMGIAGAVVGVISMLAAGLIADRLGQHDPRNRLWFIAATLVTVIPLTIASYLTPLPYALVLYFSHTLVLNVWLGPGYATAQNLCQPRMRSTVAGIMFVTNNLIGFGGGPVLVGALSDGLTAQLGEQSLRVALVAVVALGFWAALHFHLATRTLNQDLARAADAG